MKVAAPAHVLAQWRSATTLADAAASKTCLVAPPRSVLAWCVTWECDAPAGAK